MTITTEHSIPAGFCRADHSDWRDTVRCTEAGAELYVPLLTIADGKVLADPVVLAEPSTATRYADALEVAQTRRGEGEWAIPASLYRCTVQA